MRDCCGCVCMYAVLKVGAISCCLLCVRVPRCACTSTNIADYLLRRTRTAVGVNIVPAITTLVRVLFYSRLGGPDPLDYISMYSNPGDSSNGILQHWHYITFGLSDLHGDGRVHE